MVYLRLFIQCTPSYYTYKVHKYIFLSDYNLIETFWSYGWLVVSSVMYLFSHSKFSHLLQIFIRKIWHNVIISEIRRKIKKRVNFWFWTPYILTFFYYRLHIFGTKISFISIIIFLWQVNKVRYNKTTVKLFFFIRVWYIFLNRISVKFDKGRNQLVMERFSYILRIPKNLIYIRIKQK